MLIPDEAFYSTLVRIQDVQQTTNGNIDVYSDSSDSIQLKYVWEIAIIIMMRLIFVVFLGTRSYKVVQTFQEL